MGSVPHTEEWAGADVTISEIESELARLRESLDMLPAMFLMHDDSARLAFEAELRCRARSSHCVIN
jgi:hypothetical protein